VTGADHGRRQALVQDALAPSEGLLLTGSTDIRWLTGFSGSNGLVLAARGEVHLFTDGRYTEQADREASCTSIHTVEGPLHEAAVDLMKGLETLVGQADVTTHTAWQAIEHTVSGNPGCPRFISEDDGPDSGTHAALRTLRDARSAKDHVEVAAIRRALSITERVVEHALSCLREGISERDVAAEIDYHQRLDGASGSSFDTIVAFGPNSALPHARPGGTRLKPGMPILMDFGCVVDGYCSDLTRMAFFGSPDDTFLDAYRAVDDARSAAIEQAHSGLTSSALDGVARSVLGGAGLEKRFVHSLGHGVGLEVHEYPPVSFRSNDVLPEGSVITVEPGVYIPGSWGIRIEDMIMLHVDGATRLNASGTDLRIIIP